MTFLDYHGVFSECLCLPLDFYPRGASSAQVIAMIACLSVCVCDCVSHAGIACNKVHLNYVKCIV